MDAISRGSVVRDVFRGRPGSFNHPKPVHVLDESEDSAVHVRFLIIGPRIPEVACG
jgi:hypothetical protein